MRQHFCTVIPRQVYYDLMALQIAWRCHSERCHGIVLCTTKTTLKSGFWWKNKRRERKIINHHIAEGTRESHPRVNDLQYPRLSKPRRGLQIMDTRIDFSCPVYNVVIDSICLRDETTFLHRLFTPSILWRHGVTKTMTLP